MKKIVMVAIVLVMALGLSACGKDMSSSKYCGEWGADTVSSNGITLSAKTVLGTECSLSLNKNGSATFVYSETYKGKWEETSTGVSLDNGDVVLTASGDKLILDKDGVTISFVKK